MSFLIMFIVLSVVNVVFSTVRSITTIKSGKTIASIISGGYFAFYNVMLLYTVMDFPMWQKCVITFCANLVGVWIVKFAEEKARKDKLWKIEFTVPTATALEIDKVLKAIPHCYVKLSEKHTKFECFCATQAESLSVKGIVNQYNAKYFVSESKVL